MEQIETFDFSTDQDGQFLIVNTDDIIKSLFKKFKIKLSSNDIKILDDGLKLELDFGPGNSTVSTLSFKEIINFFTSEGIDNIKYDTQILKMWIEAESECLFVQTDDPKLEITPAGVDAPSGTIQIDLGEGKLYTLLYSNEEKINEAIDKCLSMVGESISSRSMVRDFQVNDHRISILRKNFGKPNKTYNDRISTATPIVKKILVHV